MKKIIFLITFLSFLGQQEIRAADSTFTTQERVERLEKSENIIKETYESKYEKLKIDFQNAVEQIKNDNKLLEYILGGIFLLGISSIIGGFFSIRKSAINQVTKKLNKYMTKKVRNQFSHLLNEEEEKIVAIIKRYVEELQIKDESSILILYKNELSNDFVDYFNNLEFKNVEYLKTSEIKNLESIKSMDLIFFYNEDKSFTQNELENLITTENPDQVYFLLTPPPDQTYRINFDDNRRKRVNMANSVISTYNNLMSTLVYQKILRNNPGNKV